MRLKTVITGSLQRLCDAGLLPELPPRAVVPASADDIGGTLSRKHIEMMTLSDISHPFYRDAQAWKQAVSVIQAFRPTGSTSDAPRFVIPLCFGSFAEPLPLQQAVDYVAGAFRACSLEVADMRGTSTVVGRMSEKIKVRSLPSFYGNWLVRRDGIDVWDRQISMELEVEAELEMQYLPGDAVRLHPVMKLVLSAPALSIIAPLESRLQRYMVPDRRLPLAPDQLIANMLARRWGCPAPFLIT